MNNELFLQYAYRDQNNVDVSEIIRRLEREKRTLLKHQMDAENVKLRIEKYRMNSKKICFLYVGLMFWCGEIKENPL